MTHRRRYRALAYTDAVVIASDGWLVVAGLGPAGPRSLLLRDPGGLGFAARADAARRALRDGAASVDAAELRRARWRVGAAASAYLALPAALLTGVASWSPVWAAATVAAAWWLRRRVATPRGEARSWHDAEHAALPEAHCGAERLRRGATLAAVATIVAVAAGATATAAWLDPLGLVLGAAAGSGVREPTRHPPEPLRLAAVRAALARLQRALGVPIAS